MIEPQIIKVRHFFAVDLDGHIEVRLFCWHERLLNRERRHLVQLRAISTYVQVCPTGKKFSIKCKIPKIKNVPQVGFLCTAHLSYQLDVLCWDENFSSFC